MPEQQLLRTAALQQGYFRTDQALAAGWTRRELNWATKTGRIDNLRYGLYRFAHFPATPLDELYEIQTLAPDGTFSHETALALYELSDVLPRTTHFSIPPNSGFKPRPGMTIHHTKIDPADRDLREGLWTTSLSRTLSDCARLGIDPDQLLAATRQGLERGLLAPSALEKLRPRYPFSLLPS